jgi:hypothetical protein
MKHDCFVLRSSWLRSVETVRPSIAASIDKALPVEVRIGLTTDIGNVVDQ